MLYVIAGAHLFLPEAISALRAEGQLCRCDEGAFPDEAISNKLALPIKQEIASPPKSTPA